MPLSTGSLTEGVRMFNAKHVIDLINQANFNFATIGTADNGTTQTLTAAMVAGSGNVTHVSAGGSTPSLTMPTAALILAAISAVNPAFNIGSSYLLTFVNTNSGTATIVTGAGITTSGTLTLATNTTRTFLMVYSAAGAFTMTSLYTGTTS